MSGTTKTNASKKGFFGRVNNKVVKDKITRSGYHVVEASNDPTAGVVTVQNEVTALMKNMASEDLEAERDAERHEYEPDKVRRLAEFLDKHRDAIILELEKEYEHDYSIELSDAQLAAAKKTRVTKVKSLISGLKHNGSKFLGTLRNRSLKRLIEEFSDRLELLLSGADKEPLNPTKPNELLSAVPATGNQVDKVFIISEGAIKLADGLPSNFEKQFLDDQKQYILTARTPAAPAKIFKTPPAESLSPILPTPLVLFHTGLLLDFAAAMVAFHLTPPRYPKNSNLEKYGTAPKDWQSDAYFMEQRVAGVNSCAVSKINEEQIQAFAKVGVKITDSSSAFVWDYRHVIEYSTEKLPATILLANYDQSNQTFKPEAVWISTTPDSSKAFAIKRDGGDIQWEFAKACVRATEWSCHEIKNHLALCHLTSEVWDVIVHHTLPRQHPVFQILLPHVFRTIPLNDDARSILVPNVIAGGNLSSMSTDDAYSFMSKMIGEWDFQKEYIPGNLKARGVDALSEKVYPFRKTALDTWTCIRSYVENVLSLVASLAGDKTILETDKYLRHWSREMQRNITNFPDLEKMGNDALYDSLTMMIYTSTHQHAAVNYFQAKYMSFLPAAPGYIRNFPTNIENMTEKELLAAFPSYQTGVFQRAMAKMLSTEPEEKHTLSHFERSPKAKETSFAVEWQQIDNDLSIMQGTLRNTLAIYSPDSVNQKNLAQSVLI